MTPTLTNLLLYSVGKSHLMQHVHVHTSDVNIIYSCNMCIDAPETLPCGAATADSLLNNTIDRYSIGPPHNCVVEKGVGTQRASAKDH